MRHADTELFKDKIEVSLDGKQIFYLFFGGAVIASLVFVLGVMVGKRVEARAHVAAQPETSTTRDPLAALDELNASERPVLAFSSVLAGQDDGPLGRLDAALAPSHDADEEHDAPSRRAGEPNRAARPAKPKAAKPKAAKAAKPKAAKAKAAKPKAADELASAAKPVAAKPEVAKLASGPAKPADAAPKPKRAAKFTLQLSSFQNRAEADSFFDTLVDSGYAPYIVEAEVPDKGTWYRVRLGRYHSYQAAIDAKLEFEKKKKIIAYVTRLKKSR